MKLFSVELRKVFARDLARLIGLLIAGVIAASAIGSLASASPLPPGAARESDEFIRQQRTDMETRIGICGNTQVEIQGSSQGIEGQSSTDVSTRVRTDAGRTTTMTVISTSTVTDSDPYLAQFDRPAPGRRECLQSLDISPSSGDDRFIFANALSTAIRISVLPLGILALILGASLGGAEWANDNMTNLLLWEPRRVRLFLAKALAAFVAITAGSLLTLGLLALTFVAVALISGTFAGVDRWWWEAIGDLTWRGVLITPLAGMLGFSIAWLVRNSVAAVAGLLVYMFVAESALRAVTNELRDWLITNNLLVAVGPPDFAQLIPGRSPEKAFLLLAAYVVGVVVLASALFWRRDVN